MVHTGQEIKDALDAEREENFRNVLRADLETQRKQNQAIMQAIRDETTTPTTTYTFVFDVTDLTDEQRDQLAMEVAVQAESSDGHPGVPSPSCEISISWEE